MANLEDVIREWARLARAVPGVGFAERQYREVEKLWLRELASRIDDATGQHDIPGGTPQAMPPPPTPAERLDGLLRESMDQTPADSHASLVEIVLRELVPDEARILAALAEGSVYPVVHVNVGAVRGLDRRVLSNASTVGRAAGVALPDRVPAYLSHLDHLGLIEFGPQEDSFVDEYEILLTDATIRRARNNADGGRIRFTKQTVAISPLGAEFWRTCRPD